MLFTFPRTRPMGLLPGGSAPASLRLPTAQALWHAQVPTPFANIAAAEKQQATFRGLCAACFFLIPAMLRGKREKLIGSINFVNIDRAGVLCRLHVRDPGVTKEQYGPVPSLRGSSSRWGPRCFKTESEQKSHVVLIPTHPASQNSLTTSGRLPAAWGTKCPSPFLRHLQVSHGEFSVFECLLYTRAGRPGSAFLVFISLDSTRPGEVITNYHPHFPVDETEVQEG